MKSFKGKYRYNKGVTFFELLTVVAIIGVLASMAVPIFANYAVQAEATEGVMLLGELRRRVEVEYNRTSSLVSEIPAAPAPTGQVFGGPYYSFSSLFGQPSDMWDRIEFQPKGPHRVLVLRAHRKAQWGNTDIGLMLQIRANADNTLDVRCTVSNVQAHLQYVPSSCRDGDVNDWTSW